jgi:hypothetical protein
METDDFSVGTDFKLFQLICNAVELLLVHLTLYSWRHLLNYSVYVDHVEHADSFWEDYAQLLLAKRKLKVVQYSFVLSLQFVYAFNHIIKLCKLQNFSTV